MLERLVDFLRLELVADVEEAIRGQADVTIRELVVFQAETPHTKRAKRFDWGLAIDAIALIGEGHRTSL
jgi:hypothetical protein